MTPLHITINLLAYGIFGMCSLLAWPSRRNVVAWTTIPFFVVSYVIPLLAINYLEAHSLGTIDSLTWINALGAAAMVIGVLIGSRWRRPLRNPLVRWWRSGAETSDMALSTRRTWQLMMIGCIVMTLCFVWMRMVPMFADDPFLAKFFRGQYKERYDQVSVPYRLAQAMLGVALPISMVYLVSLRDRKQLLPVIWAVALFAVSLNRGTVLAGAVLIVAAWASRRRMRVLVFLSITTLIYCVGSGVYALLGLIDRGDASIWTQIALGAPDITDHLDFLGAFRDSDLTYGLTFFGGLVPGNFRYNPSVYTLAIVNGTFDVSDLASGGLRLPPSVAGYMAFSWVGAALVPFFSGVLTGHFTTRLRLIPRDNLSQQVVALSWYGVCAGFWISFYAMAYQGLISLVLFSYMVPSLEALGSPSAVPSRRRRRRRWLSRHSRPVVATT